MKKYATKVKSISNKVELLIESTGEDIDELDEQYTILTNKEQKSSKGHKIENQIDSLRNLIFDLEDILSDLESSIEDLDNEY